MKHKQIRIVCLKCGKKYKTKEKSVMGSWMAVCDICGKEDWCAAAGHDFGIREDYVTRM